MLSKSSEYCRSNTGYVSDHYAISDSKEISLLRRSYLLIKRTGGEETASWLM